MAAAVVVVVAGREGAREGAREGEREGGENN